MYQYSTISFPGLGIELDPVREFPLGPLSIHMYGLIIACGLMAAVLYACRRSKEFGLKEDDILDGVLWVTPFAIACARYDARKEAEARAKPRRAQRQRIAIA